LDRVGKTGSRKVSSQAEKILEERDKPRNTPNTRKASREEVCFPRNSRIPRLIPAFGCGFAPLLAGVAGRGEDLHKTCTMLYSPGAIC
jgi:hypothetical protein